jgi:hypothetical protein
MVGHCDLVDKIARTSWSMHRHRTQIGPLSKVTVGCITLLVSQYRRHTYLPSYLTESQAVLASFLYFSHYDLALLLLLLLLICLVLPPLLID